MTTPIELAREILDCKDVDPDYIDTVWGLAIQLAQAVIDSPKYIGGIDWGKDYLEEIRQQAREEQNENATT